jgi:transcription elongation GreA/GreB family factor
MAEPSKRELLAEVRRKLEDEIATMARAAASAREAATHEEAKPENDKDTRSIEAAYLAGAQADRVAQLEHALSVLQFLALREFGPRDPIASGALVETQSGGRREILFVLPVAGGLVLEHAGQRVRTITTSSPLGSVLLGNQVEDSIEFESPTGLRHCEILRVW